MLYVKLNNFKLSQSSYRRMGPNNKLVVASESLWVEAD